MYTVLSHPDQSTFFFQAEDGIRDHCVTGVQTCALPISFSPGQIRDAQEIAQASSEKQVPQGRRGARAHAGRLKIGRASCRERVEVWGGAEAVKKRKIETKGVEWTITSDRQAA